MYWALRAALCLIAAWVFSPSASAQGFGKLKKSVTLVRKLPPIAPLTGSFAIQSSPRDKQYSDLAQKLADVLETELLQHNQQLLSNKANPDTTLTLTVISYSPPRANMVTKTEYTSRGAVNHQSEEISGSLLVAYQAKAHTGKVLDSDNVSARFSGEFQNGKVKSVENVAKKPLGLFKKGEQAPEAHSAEEVTMILVSQAANEIASRLVRTDEKVEALLARGKLDSENKIAEAGQWSRMLEPLETMTPLPTKEQDAYRLYNIGVAYEAMAYQAEDTAAARKFLDLAAINYGKAIDGNPAEKYFLEPQNRIQTALAHFRKLQGQTTAAASKPAPAPTQTAGSNGALTNDQVIALQKAGMDQGNLIATIKDAKSVDFDLSTDAQLKLVQNGVNGPVLAAMRDRARSAAVKNAGTPKK